MTRDAHWRHRFRAGFESFAASCSALPSPRPMPAKEWSVVPPTRTAAAPVEAVTKTRRPTRFAARMASLSAKDLPVPCVFHCLFGHERRFGGHDPLLLSLRDWPRHTSHVSRAKHAAEL